LAVDCFFWLLNTFFDFGVQDNALSVFLYSGCRVFVVTSAIFVLEMSGEIKQTVFKFVFDEEWTVETFRLVQELEPYRFKPQSVRSQNIWNTLCAKLLSKREVAEKKNYSLTKALKFNFICNRFKVVRGQPLFVV